MIILFWSNKYFMGIKVGNICKNTILKRLYIEIGDLFGVWSLEFSFNISD